MPECYDLHQLYKLGLEGKRQQCVKRRKGFKLLCLPVLARNEVIRSMDIDEIIKLSMSSRRMEGIIRYTQVKSNKIEFQVKNNNSILQIESFNEKVYNCSPDRLKERSIHFSSQVLSQWIDKTSSSFRKSVAILKHLQNIISFGSLCLHVNLRGMTARFFKEILTEPSLRDFESLRLENGEIDAECLDLVMGMAQNNRVLHIKGTMIPRDYYHENAFKFHDVYYNDAEWVCIENLLTLKDSYSVNLGWNLLTQHDVNTFIKFWIESEHDMVQSLSFRLLLAFRIERFFDDVVVLKGRPAIYLVVANPNKQRKRPILSITCHPNGMLCLKSCDKDETFRLRGSLNDESWAPEYKVLMMLNMKKELEGKLEEIQKLFETSEDQNKAESKNEIAKELQNISQRLDSLNFGLVLRDGVYCYE